MVAEDSREDHQVTVEAAAASQKVVRPVTAEAARV